MSISGAPITGDGRAAIEKIIDVADSDLFKSITEDKLEDVFELERCRQWIRQSNFENICVQFPDEYLTHAPAIVDLLQDSTGKKVYVLADSTYGSCCVDEKTAHHVPNADSLIHFGPSCLSSTSGRMPVLYIFSRPLVNLEKLENIFRENFNSEEKIIISYDVIYEYAVDVLFKKICDSYPATKKSTLMVPSDLKTDSTAAESSVPGIVKHNRRIPCETSEELEEHKIFFVGHRSLPNLLLSMSNNVFKVYDPALTNQQSIVTQTSAINRLLRKRSFYVEKIKDVKIVGILVGTLVVQNYLSLIDRLKKILKSAGKQYYIVSIGEINPCKLGNFMDIECFVFVGCPEVINYYISDESKGQFFQPILTPYDVELAFCEGVNEKWGHQYVIDWSFLVETGEPQVKQIDEDVSLITGGLRSAVNTRSSTSETDGIDTDSSGVVNWRGLTDKEEDLNDPNVIYQGRSGIAASYSDEPSVNHDKSG